MAPRILVADDDNAIRRMLSTLLTREGFSVDSAADGDEAIEKLAVARYDAIILDLMMPKVSGFDVLDHLERAEPRAAENFVIVLTAASHKDLSRLDGKDVFRVMRKPFDVPDLIGSVRECIAASSRASTGERASER
jgi:CheY-like chemotaxis protein